SDLHAVYSQRGRLDVNLVEDSISFYRSADAKNYLERKEGSPRPAPFWTVTRSAKEAEDPSTGVDRVIRLWRWLPDSSGITFVAAANTSAWQLTLADLRSKKIEALTPETVSVRSLDIRDRQHYAYTAVEMIGEAPRVQAPAKVGTGHNAFDLFFPKDADRWSRPASLWAVIAGRRFQVKTNGTPFVPEPGYELALSPDGESVATVLRSRQSRAIQTLARTKDDASRERQKVCSA